MNTLILTKEQEKKFEDNYHAVRMQRECENDLLALAERANEEPPPLMDFYNENHFDLSDEEFELFKEYLTMKDAEESNSFKEFMKTIGVQVPEPVLN